MNRTSSSRNAEPRARRSSGHRTASAPPVSVHVEREQDELLYRQVYRELVQLIQSGRLRPAARLPSSRVLAQELGIGRNTVLLALEHLMSEGYVETRRGHGTYVAAELPDRTPLRCSRSSRCSCAAAGTAGAGPIAGLACPSAGDDIRAVAPRRTWVRRISLQALGAALVGELAPATPQIAQRQSCSRIPAAEGRDRRLPCGGARHCLHGEPGRDRLRNPPGADGGRSLAARPG